MTDRNKDNKQPKKPSAEPKSEGLSDKVNQRMNDLSDRLEQEGDRLEEVIGDKAKQLEEALSPENLGKKAGQAKDKGREILGKMQEKWQDAKDQNEADKAEIEATRAARRERNSVRQSAEEAKGRNSDAYQKMQDALNKQDGNQKRATGSCPEAVSDEAYYTLMSAQDVATKWAPNNEWSDKSQQQLSRTFNKAVEKKEILQVKNGQKNTYPAYLVDRENGRFYKETPKILEKLSTKFNADEMHQWFLTKNPSTDEKPADLMATSRGRLKVKAMARNASRS